MAESDNMNDGIRQIGDFEKAIKKSHNEMEKQFLPTNFFLRNIKGGNLKESEITQLCKALSAASSSIDEYRQFLSGVKETLSESKINAHERNGELQHRDKTGRQRAADSGVFSTDSTVLSREEQEVKYPKLVTQPTDSVEPVSSSTPEENTDETDV